MIYFAPMEGITGYVFRNIHHAMFPGVDRYYTPFLSANHTHSFRSKEGRDIDPASNRVPCLIPQLLTNSAEDFLWAANRMASIGYREVNLNLGCPSSTVTAKKKGAGFLRFPDLLDGFFEQVFNGLETSENPIKISVKTRLGVQSPEEAVLLMEIYNRYPISELIIHARIRDDLYKGSPRLETFQMCYEESRHPVCYNGDIYTVEDHSRILSLFPGLSAVMIGRGLITDPALCLEINGTVLEDHQQTLMVFHDRLYEGYCETMSARDAVFHMKEVWYYMEKAFPGCEKQIRKMLKSKNDIEYLKAVEALKDSLKIN